MKKSLFLMSLLWMLASCNTTKNGMPEEQPQLTLENTQWILVDQPTDAKPISLSIETGRISGNAGCNNYFSTKVLVDTSKGMFSSKNIATTLMVCKNMNTEATYLALLERANRYVIHGSYLELYENRLLLLKFKRRI